MRAAFLQHQLTFRKATRSPCPRASRSTAAFPFPVHVHGGEEKKRHRAWWEKRLGQLASASSSKQVTKPSTPSLRHCIAPSTSVPSCSDSRTQKRGGNAAIKSWTLSKLCTVRENDPMVKASPHARRPHERVDWAECMYRCNGVVTVPSASEAALHVRLHLRPRPRPRPRRCCPPHTLTPFLGGAQTWTWSVGARDGGNLYHQHR